MECTLYSTHRLRLKAMIIMRNHFLSEEPTKYRIQRITNFDRNEIERACAANGKCPSWKKRPNRKPNVLSICRKKSHQHAYKLFMSTAERHKIALSMRNKNKTSC